MSDPFDFTAPGQLAKLVVEILPFAKIPETLTDLESRDRQSCEGFSLFVSVDDYVLLIKHFFFSLSC
jgi:hypothetical protein